MALPDGFSISVPAPAPAPPTRLPAGQTLYCAALSLTAILQGPLASFNGLDDNQASLLGQALGVETVDELLDNELIGRIVQLRSTGVV